MGDRGREHNIENENCGGGGFRIIEGGSKGTNVYVSDNNFIYSKDKISGMTLYLRCVDRKNGCFGTAQINDGILVHCRPHNHDPDNQNLDRREAKTSLKRRAETTRDPFRVIYDDESNERGNMEVTFHEIHPAMAKRRRVGQPKYPETVEDFQSAMNGEVVYRGTVRSGDQFGLVFASDEAITMLQQSKEVHADATFKVVPKNYHHRILSEQSTSFSA